MVCSRFRAVLIFCMMLGLLSGFQASAEDIVKKGEGMETRLFRNAVDTKGHVTVDGSSVLPHLAFSVGLMLDFGFNYWVAVEQDGDLYEKTLMERYFTGVFMGNLGLYNWAVVGLQIPMGITQGSAFNGPGVSSEEWSTKGAFGDLALHAKVGWLRMPRFPVGLATVIQYQFGSGKSELLMGEPGSGGAISAKLVFEAKARRWYRVALNGGIRYAFSAKEDNHLDEAFNNGSEDLLFHYGPILNFGVGQSFSMAPGVIDFVLEVYGNQLTTEFGNMSYFSLEANGAFKIFVDRNSYLIAGAAAGLPIAGTDSGYGFQSPEWRIFLGISFEPSIGDRDGDGIMDDVDQCPDDPEDLDDFEDSDGCPDPDNDRDGIPDVEDDCPMVPEDFDGNDDLDGCPESEKKRVRDRDKDGIPDDVDECPREREDFDGFEDSDGCPDPDNDEDGIPDALDDCPMVKEVLNGFEDSDGCPDEGEELVTITEDQVMLLKGVRFKTASDVIVGQQSFDILDAVAAVLMANPTMKVRVEGHTDSRGKYQYNVGLSQRRAASVKRYLNKEKGIKRSRMKAKGYGPDQPVDTNDTEEGRTANRRVVFTILGR